VLLVPSGALGALISGSGGGGAIPDASAITSDIVLVSPLSVTGDLTVTINNLTHTWAGDLTATLTHVGSGTSQSLFFKIGNPPNGLGDSSDFGGSYRFNNSFTGDLWAVAAGLTGAGIIPGGDYFATGAGSSSAIDLSNFFNGLSAGGTWRLAIQDTSGGDTGSFSGWDLSFQAEAVPEPSYAMPILVLGILGVGRHFWRKHNTTATSV